MNLNSFAWAQTFVESHGYLLIFLIMVIEGPVITTAAAFAASLGFFNIWIIFLLSILGDFVGDVLHFLVGKIIRKTGVQRYGHHVGLSKLRIAKLERQLQKNMGKTLFFIKLTPLAGTGILLAGALKGPWLKFLLFSFLITVPRAIFFTLLGFFFGWAVNTVLKAFSWGQYALLALFLFFIVFIIVYKKVTATVRAQL